MISRIAALLAAASVTYACGSADSASSAEAPTQAGDAGADVTATGDSGVADAQRDAPSSPDASPGVDAGPACTTRVTYGSTWIHPNHPDAFDIAAGQVTWDGTCTDDGPNSYAVLSNGWKPYFSGNGACTIALDWSHCAGAPTACGTRVAYGPAWLAPGNHPQHYDDVGGALLWDGMCRPDGALSYAALSNGWAPHFNGACDLSFNYEQCGGLYANPVIPFDCPDPGVLRDGSKYVLVCTSGGAADAFPIRVSTDLVTWTDSGHIFPSARRPSWARGDFWAPEIHKVGAGYVAYFTARGADGVLAIGAATAPTATGPFTDIGAPLVHDPNMGLIDATEYEDPSGKRYVIWKEDGNAVGRQTPIHAQELNAAGTALVGSRVTLITNDRAWEGAVVEGPWMIDHGGEYYLFYSGASYADATYAVGVARATSPLGPFTKAGAPILVTNDAWVGPGHCSVVDSPNGETTMVYHAWVAGHVNGPGDGRETLVDRVLWNNGWPEVPAGPSARSLPLP